MQPCAHLDRAQTRTGIAEHFVATFDGASSGEGACGAAAACRVAGLGADDQGGIDLPADDVLAQRSGEVLRGVPTHRAADPTVCPKPGRLCDPARRMIAADHQNAGCGHGVDAVPDRHARIGERSAGRFRREIDGVDDGRGATGDLADSDEYRGSWVDGHGLVARPFETTTLSRCVRASTIA